VALPGVLVVSILTPPEGRVQRRKMPKIDHISTFGNSTWRQYR
jgi:hypothetical protein